MKTKPFQFRYVNELVGGFVLLVVLLLVLAIVLAGRAQGWFEPVHEMQIDFPAEGSLDLQIGSPVQILGATVGRLEMIDVDDEGAMVGAITIKDDFYQFVRADSMAIVKKKFGIAGEAFIEITKGISPDLPAENRLAAVKDTDLNQLLQELLTQVKEAVLPLLDSYKNLADEYAGLASDLRAEQGPLGQSLANIEAITRKLDEGEGPAGLLLSDEALAGRIDEMVKQVSDVIRQLEVIMKDVRGATVELPPIAHKVNRELDDLPGTMLMTQEAISEAGRLLEGIQRHWLVRKYVPAKPGTPAIIPLYDVPESAARHAAPEEP